MRCATPSVSLGLDMLTRSDSVDSTGTMETTVIDIKPPQPHISYSQLDMYRRCSMQYYFRYILGQKDRPGLALSLGKAGHAALESNARRTMKTGAPMPLVELTDKFSDAYDAATNELEPSDLDPDENLGHTKDGAVQTLRVYHKDVAPNFRPALVEHEFNLDLSKLFELEYPIKIVNGRIDYITITDDIDDYKWAGKAKNQNEVNLTPQLTLYDLVYLATFGVEAKSLGLTVMLPPGKSLRDPTPARVQQLNRAPEYMTPEAKAGRRLRLVHQLSTTTRAIDQGIFQPTDNPIVCGWCGYRDKCQFSLTKQDWQAIAIRQKT